MAIMLDDVLGRVPVASYDDHMEIARMENETWHLCCCRMNFTLSSDVSFRKLKLDFYKNKYFTEYDSNTANINHDGEGECQADDNPRWQKMNNWNMQHRKASL